MVKISERLQHRYERVLLDLSNECAKWQVPIEDFAPRNWLLRKMGLKIGKPVFIDTGLQFEHGFNISIGDYTFIRQGAHLADWGKIDIGCACLIARGFTAITGSHDKSNLLSYIEEISIGDHCFIGANVTVLSNVKIGNNCIIGAGSVVNKNIPDKSIAVGCPAKVIGKRKRIPFMQYTGFGFWGEVK